MQLFGIGFQNFICLYWTSHVSIHDEFSPHLIWALLGSVTSKNQIAKAWGTGKGQRLTSYCSHSLLAATAGMPSNQIWPITWCKLPHKHTRFGNRKTNFWSTANQIDFWSRIKQNFWSSNNKLLKSQNQVWFLKLFGGISAANHTFRKTSEVQQHNFRSTSEVQPRRLQNWLLKCFCSREKPAVRSLFGDWIWALVHLCLIGSWQQ